MTDTKLCVSVVFLSTEDNSKPLKQLGSRFRRIITWYKPLIKVTTLAQNQQFDFLIDPCFQGVSRHFAWLFRNTTDRTTHTKYNEPTAKITNVITINEINFFDQPVNNGLKAYDNFQKIFNSQEHDYTTGCQLDYACLFQRIL